MPDIPEELCRKVQMYVFGQSAETARVPQAPQISEALGVEIETIRAALKQLALNRVLILAPNDTSIWAANPFCAVPSGFRPAERPIGESASGMRWVLPRPCKKTPSLMRHVEIAALRCAWKSPAARLRAAKELSISQFRLTIGGTTSLLLEAPCFSSGLKNTWIDGAVRARCSAAGCSA